MFMGSSTGDLLVEHEADQRRVFSTCAELGLLLAVHSEDEGLIRRNRVITAKPALADHNRIRSPEAAIISTRCALRLQEESGCRLLVLHVSTPKELDMIRQAKDQGQEVYAEICPHHWVFDDTILSGPRAGFYKVNPPLRSPAQRSRYLDLLITPGLLFTSGVVDIISPDHAPHTIEEKCRDNYDDVPSGMPGVQELFPLAWGLVKCGVITMEHFIELTSTNAARLFGLPNGRLEPGYTADLAFFDPGEGCSSRTRICSPSAAGRLMTACQCLVSPISLW
jgi:dihydroorotase